MPAATRARCHSCPLPLAGRSRGSQIPFHAAKGSPALPVISASTRLPAAPTPLGFLEQNTHRRPSLDRSRGVENNTASKTDTRSNREDCASPFTRFTGFGFCYDQYNESSPALLFLSPAFRKPHRATVNDIHTAQDDRGFLPHSNT